MLKRKTKIVATLGPASDSPEMIRNLLDAGVDVFRFNTKHSTLEWHEERIHRVREASVETDRAAAILLDLQGPEIRTETREGVEIPLNKGEEIGIACCSTEEATVAIPYKEVFESLDVGDTIFIDDAYVELEVISKKGLKLVLKATDNCVIKPRKTVNLPGKTLLGLPSLTDRDADFLDMAGRVPVEYLGLSFVRDLKDIEILKSEMKKRKITSGVVVKIENQEALKNVDELVREADAVMVARGDLGIEVPIEELAYWQDQIIFKSRNADTPVIVATQMLESMMENPRPTRAEASDVAHAVYDGADALMLSGETATGKFPLKVVKTMDKIIRYNENKQKVHPPLKDLPDMTNLIVRLADEVVRDPAIRVDKVVVFTQSGRTALSLSAYRPAIPTIAVTEHSETVGRLALSFGVSAKQVHFPLGRLRNPEYVVKQLKEVKLVKKGDVVLLVHGTMWREPGGTNAVAIMEV